MTGCVKAHDPMTGHTTLSVYSTNFSPWGRVTTHGRDGRCVTNVHSAVLTQPFNMASNIRYMQLNVGISYHDTQVMS